MVCSYGTAHISGTDCLIRSEFSLKALVREGSKCFTDKIILNPGSGGQSLSLPTQEPSLTLPPSVQQQLFYGHEIANVRRRSPQPKDRRTHNGWKGLKLLKRGRPPNGCEDILLPDLFHLPAGNPFFSRWPLPSHLASAKLVDCS